MNTNIDIDKIINHLYIEIIGDLKVWRRNSEDIYSSSQYMKILIESIKHITGDNCFENRHKFEYTKKYFPTSPGSVTVTQVLEVLYRVPRKFKKSGSY